MGTADQNEPLGLDKEEQDIDPFHEEFELPSKAELEATGLTIESMNLVSEVAAKARELQKHAPGVRFTSGRRDLAKQAHAMAGNVVKNRKWIAQTYKATTAIQQLQHWVDTHPGATSVDEIAKGLAAVMNAMPDAQRTGISRHLSGRAFDVAPGSAPASAIQALKPRKFLQKEGGLVIWHVDF